MNTLWFWSAIIFSIVGIVLQKSIWGVCGLIALGVWVILEKIDEIRK